MELDNTFQIPSENLQTQKFDAFIAVSGYESRSSYLSEKINIAQIPVKIAIAYDEFRDVFFRSINDRKFSDWGFTFFTASSREDSVLPQIMDLISANCEGKNTLNILIDYSSMSKVWYSGILNYFSALEERFTHIYLWFCYSPSTYTKTQFNPANKLFDPLLPVAKEDKPVALVLGLGYETGYSEILAQQLNAQEIFAFHADPAYDERYVREVLENNRGLLQRIKQEQIIKYPIYDLNGIYSSLTELCIEIRLTHQLVLAPIGPKPFTLMCFILSTRFPDIKLWKVSTTGNIVTSDRKPYGELLLYKVGFTSEEVDY